MLPWGKFVLGFQILISLCGLAVVCAANFGFGTKDFTAFEKVFVTTCSCAGIAAPIGMFRGRWWGYLLEFAVGAPAAVYIWMQPSTSRHTGLRAFPGNVSGAFEWLTIVALLGYCLVHGIYLLRQERQIKGAADPILLESSRLDFAAEEKTKLNA
jgi:hypothetical protein